MTFYAVLIVWGMAFGATLSVPLYFHSDINDWIEIGKTGLFTALTAMLASMVAAFFALKTINENKNQARLARTMELRSDFSRVDIEFQLYVQSLKNTVGSNGEACQFDEALKNIFEKEKELFEKLLKRIFGINEAIELLELNVYDRKIVDKIITDNILFQWEVYSYLFAYIYKDKTELPIYSFIENKGLSDDYQRYKFCAEQKKFYQ
ncbi:hypothetical protein J3998_09015 [Thiomicrorhabdus sp. 6S2-11]|uniref:DUF4760 domain-containing protein n=1 Tax=Thiomicrorhabdus marina TaxID=2818442 RepID=A0ABS3Q6Y9_9GAMM|nr:hypothetical protein [Thiomicrorhabdus marina]MBO1927714.1 hypothetical protein [Thiomicrorhabdus marina]